jgi:hypothetical protein
MNFIQKGERYDVIVDAKNKPDSYWIKVKGFADCSVFRVYEKAMLFYDDSTSTPAETFQDYRNISRVGLVNQT